MSERYAPPEFHLAAALYALSSAFLNGGSDRWSAEQVADYESAIEAIERLGPTRPSIMYDVFRMPADV